MNKKPKTLTDLTTLERVWYLINPWAKAKWYRDWVAWYENELPYIYEEITGGTLSYPAYDKYTVLECYEENVSRQVSYAIDDFLEDNNLDKKKKWVR